MPERDLIIDFSAYDLNQVVADKEEIREYIPQRYAMEQLDAIVYDDNETGICVGYKDLSDDEFWVAGHMPNMPLMPGVMMCEAAAQLCTFQVQRHGAMRVELIGFGGLDHVRFRGVVRPGDRLVIVTRRIKLRPNMMIRSQFECFVDQELVCEGELIGVALPADALRD